MMQPPRSLLPAAVVLYVMVLLPPSAMAADPRVAVIDTVQASLTLKLNARQAVASALDDLGVAMVPLEDLTPEDAACSESRCYATVAKRVGATHLLVMSGVANPAGYRLSLDVRDGVSGRSLGTDGKDCELCAEDQFASTLQERVTSLWKRVAREEERAEAASHRRRLKPVVAEPGESRSLPSREVSPWWTQTTPLVGLGLGVVGLVGVGFGSYYIAVDGKTVEENHPLDPASSHPILVRDTGRWGWTFLGLGAVSLVAGTAMVIWGRDDDSGGQRDVSALDIVVGPGSLGLQGRF